MTDHETITVAIAYIALALVGPFMISMLLRWAEGDEAKNLACEIGAALESLQK